MKFKRLLSALIKYWYLFLLWAVAVVFFWVWLVGMITRASAEEKLGVFVCSEYCDQAELVNKLQSVRPDYAAELEFRYVSSNDGMFSVYYDAFAVYSCDIIILPSDKLSDISYVDFYGLDKNITDNLFSSPEYYSADNGGIYGIKIDAEKSLGHQTQTSVDYFLFFNKNSLHLGELSGSRLSGALTLAQVFI